MVESTSQDRGNGLDSADAQHLRRALALAVETGDAGNRPFGAVIVDATGVVVSEGANSVATSGDVTEHAELDAVTTACAEGNTERLVGAVVYASGEPCPMCAAALVWSGVGRVVFASAAAEFGELLADGPRFALRCADVIASADAGIEVSGPHLGDEALEPFRRYVAEQGMRP
ncbi:nucleoside deaminase [Rhodococcus sp. NPDC003318]|uniref:nucleoside deaminase n=1 Tax=Rhodococcus sp. NPDC003318 TaxID=3364503 RepID=UPI003694A433